MMKRSFFYTCFCATSITLLLNSCKSPDAKIQTVSSRVIANRATSAIATSFSQSQTQVQTPEPNLITIKADQGSEAEAKIDSLKNAIKLADDIDKEVHQSLNTDILSKAYTGAELQKKQAFIKELKSNKAYIYSKLRQQEFKNFEISSDGLTAKVDLIETWSHKIFSQESNELLAKSSASEVMQTNYLQKTKDGWLISNTVFNSNPPTFKVFAKSE